LLLCSIYYGSTKIYIVNANGEMGLAREIPFYSNNPNSGYSIDLYLEVFKI
jgi:hypothetical protein